MSGVFLELEVAGFDAAIGVLNRLGRTDLLAETAPLVGGLVESQTRLRFQTKVAPDGTPWAPWSPGYAASRHDGHSLLENEGHLRDSIAPQINDAELHIGSNLVYAAIQQFGGQPSMRPGPAAIPGREYLGLNDENVHEIERELIAWTERVLH